MQSCMNLNNDNLIILIIIKVVYSINLKLLSLLLSSSLRFRLQTGFNDYSLFTAFTNLDHINIKNRNQ